MRPLGYLYARNGTYYVAYKRPDGRWVRESAETDRKTLAKAVLYFPLLRDYSATD